MPFLEIPVTRNHRQLARWINQQSLVDARGRRVVAHVASVKTSTDRLITGARFRIPGRGRRGLLLEIWPADVQPFLAATKERLYSHESSETYRRHAEARTWVAQHLRRLP